MKKKILLFTAIAGFCYLLFSSYVGGPAYNGVNRTGAQASIANCGGSVGGTSCHGTGTTTSVTITLDSGTTAITQYVPGHTYTVHIHGTNTSSLPRFGFEFAAVGGSGASQYQAGTFPTPTAPIYADPGPGSLTYVEHGAAIAGSPAGTYNASFQWTAPSASVGLITMYCTLNAVNGNGNADAADISGNTSLFIVPVGALNVNEVPKSLDVQAYPNPVSDNLNLEFSNAQSGSYAVQVYDMAGRAVYRQNMEVNSLTKTSINTSKWIPGIYQVMVEKDGAVKTISIVK